MVIKKKIPGEKATADPKIKTNAKNNLNIFSFKIIVVIKYNEFVSTF
jgi:hypothetical protein